MNSSARKFTISINQKLQHALASEPEASLRDAAVAVDSLGRVIYWSAGAEAMLGWTPDEALDRTLHELVVPPRQRESVAARWQDSINHYDHRRIRVLAQTRDHGEKPIIVEIQPAIAEGKTIRIARLYDVRNDFAADQEKARQDQRLQDILDAIPLPIFHKAQDGRYTGHNRAFAELLVPVGESVVGKTVHDIAPKEYADVYAAKDAALFNGTEQVQVYEETVRGLDGIGRVIRFHKAAVGADGKTGLVGVMLDVSDLRREQALHSALVERAPCGVALVRPDGTIRFANAALGHMVGLTAEAMSGRRWADFLWHDPANGSEPPPAFDVEVGPQVYCTVGRLANGSHAHWEVHTSPIALPEGRFVHMVVINVTEHHKREMKLREARDAAEAANRAKDAFLSNISHELRTPINAILGFSELFSPEGDEASRSYLQYIRAGASRLAALVNDLIDLSRIEAGVTLGAPADFCLIGMLESVISDFAHRATGAGVDMRWQFGNIPHRILGPEMMIRRVLGHLLSNAIKFTPNGGSVTVSANSTSSTGEPSLVVAVADTGVGIDPSQADHIFERFSQAGDVYTKRHEGLGTGLFLCRTLVEQMGGKLTYTSQVGKGSCFSFTIPLPVPKSAGADPSDDCSCHHHHRQSCE